MASTFPATSMPDRDWWAALWPDPSSLLRALGVRADMTALDLCCGDGYFTAPLARIVGGRVYALDIDAEMIAQARDEAERQGVGVLQWITADAREVAALIPEQVDYVLLSNTFHGVPDKPGLAKVVADVLRPGGLFAIVNWHRTPREETTVLGVKRGPPTESRMSPACTQETVEPQPISARRSAAVPLRRGVRAGRMTSGDLSRTDVYGTQREEEMSSETPVDPAALREEVKSKYREVAINPHGEFHFHTGRPLAARLGYDTPTVDALPDAAVESFAGVANPFSLRPLQPGARVVDVGSGGGFDCFIAAGQVGPEGRVVGIDMTDEMLDKARATAVHMGLSSVEFRKGIAEDMPVEDGSADVVISNGVINLCADKRAVFGEIFRVLRPGGRLQFADIANGQPVPEAAIRNIDLWTA